MGLRMCHQLKVACVAELKLAFMEWFFYNLVMLIKLYKIGHLNLDRLFVWKVKNFDELQLPEKLILFAEILHTFPI